MRIYNQHCLSLCSLSLRSLKCLFILRNCFRCEWVDPVHVSIDHLESVCVAEVQLEASIYRSTYEDSITGISEGVTKNFVDGRQSRSSDYVSGFGGYEWPEMLIYVSSHSLGE